MKFLLYIAVWGRPRITRMCFDGVERLIRSAPKGVEVLPWIVGSEDDMKLLADDYGFPFVYANNDPLGAKMNKGLIAATGKEWDYLIQLGSDDILRPDYWVHVLPYLKEGKQFIGFNQLYVYDLETRRAVISCTRSVIFGAGRIVARELVEACEYRLWPDQINRVLDLKSEERIGEVTNVWVSQVPTVWKPLVVDVKDGTGIHAFDEFKGEEVSAMEVETIFPEVAALHDPVIKYITTVG